MSLRVSTPILGWDAQYSADGNPAVFDLYTNSLADMRGGLQLAVRSRWNITFDWARYRDTEQTVHALAMGLSYRFD